MRTKMPAIIRYAQGKVEIIIRAITIVVAFTTVIAAAVALGEGLGNDFLSGVITAIRVFESSLSGLDTVLDLPSVRDGSVGIAGYILTVALLALLLQTVMVVIRCLVVKGNGVFFISNTILSFVLALAFGVGTITAAVFASKWPVYDDDVIDGVRIDGFLQQAGIDRDTNIVRVMESSLAAAAVFCCIEAFVFVFLGIWMLLFLLCDWNDKAPKI